MERSFQDKKSALTTPPVLSFPSNNVLFILDTDASNEAIGAVLSEISENGNEFLIQFASTRKELLAVVHYMKWFRHYLLGRNF